MKALLLGMLAFVGIKPTQQAVTTTTSPGATAQKVEDNTKDVPILGGFQKMELSAASEVNKFLDSHLQGVKGLKLVSYEKQVVNGFNHKLTYENKNGKHKEVIVYETIDGKLSITAGGDIQEEM